MNNQGHYTITLDNNYNVKNIYHNVGAHRHSITQTNGTSVLILSSGGSITGNGSVWDYTPIRLEGGSGGTYAFSQAGTLLIYGPVSGTAAAGGNYDLILSGLTSTESRFDTSGAYVGSLGDGVGGGTLSVLQTNGFWHFKNPNTYSGTTTVRNGRMKFTDTTAPFGSSSTAIVLGDSGTASGDNIELEHASNGTMSRNISVNNFNTAGTTLLSVRNNLGTPVFSGQVTLNRTVTIHTENSGYPTFSGKLTGTGGIIKTGADRATLSGNANDYQGGTAISAGLLIASGTGALGTGPVTVSNGTLRANDGVGLSTAVNLPLYNGVWESGANITRTLGSAANQVQLSGTSGFSAYGASINVNLNGGAGLVWGSTAGLSPTTLVLNQTTANNQLTFQNALDLNGADRTIAVNNNTAVISAPISNSSGTAGIVKSGSGTLKLTGTNTFNGAVDVQAGTLTADYTGKNTGDVVIPSGTAVTLRGVTLSVTGSGVAGQTTAQTLGGLTLDTGANAVSVTANGSRPVVLNLGAITRPAGGGTVNFTLPTGTQDATNGITTTFGTANSRLGMWATVNGTEWAAKDAENDNIVPWSSVGGTYTDVTRLSSGAKTIASNPGSDVRIIEGTGTAADITLAAAGTTDIGTLLHTATGGATTNNPGSTDILRLGADGGLTMVSGAQVLYLGAAADDGQLTAGGAANTAGKLTVVNNSANRLYINSTVVDNGSGVVSLEKGGSGNLNLLGNNTFSGGVTISGGGVYASGPSTNVLGTGRLTLNGGVFSLHTSDAQNPTNQYVGSIAGNSGSALIRAGNKTLTFGIDNTSSTYMGGWEGGTFTKVGTGTTTVFSASSIAPSTIQGFNVDQGTVKLGAAKDFPSTCPVNVKGTLDLNGYSANIRLGSLYTGGTMLTGGGTFTNLNAMQFWGNPSGLPATATFIGNWYMPANPTFRGDANATLVIDGVLSGGAGTVTADGNMQATAVIRLSGSASNTFSGTWSVSKGTTELNKSGGAIAIPTNITMSAGTVKWLADEQVADGATVTMSGSGKLNMNGFSDWVRTLILGGVTQAEGTWGGTGSGAQFTNTTYFTAGAGMLRVGVKPLAAPCGTTFVVR